MKTIYRLLALLSLTALALAPLARADEPPPGPPPAGDQGRPDPAKRREHRLQMLDEKLSLTAEQKEQIKAIWAKAGEQGKALRAEASAARDDLRAKGMEMMKATHAQVRAVLTPDQQKIFDALPPEMHGHRGPRHGDGDKPADAPPKP
jgi:Spy/CpxP family protein refolding chaperone